MRADAQGLLWHDLPKVKGKGSRGPKQRGAMPPIPETGWTPPTEFPNLSAAKIIGFDVETYDPEIKKAGPGWGRGKGHLIGASVAVEDGSSWYFPFGHGFEDGKQVLPPEHAAMNMNRDHVLSFLQHTLGDTRPKAGANLIYDVGWLMHEGVTVNGPLYDVQFAEALLNSETPRVDLDSLGETHLGMGKTTSQLYQWLADWLGGKPNEKQRAGMYLTPPSLAGPYGEADAALPIQILTQQWPQLVNRGVMDLFDIECRLIPLLVRMRLKGAPVDLNRAEQLYDELGEALGTVENRLKQIAGVEVNPNARDSMVAAFTKLGLDIPQKFDVKEKKAKISFDAERLEGVNHPLAEAILEHRQTSKVRNTFIKSYIIDKNVNSRVYCSFHPLKNDGGGARSGRFSSSDPNLQNIPVRSDIGKKVRTAFVATGNRWRKADYSQIEYRMLAHHAVGEGADALRSAYNENPKLDYHDKTIDLVEQLTGVRMERRPAKTINFGLIYGMGEGTLAARLKLQKAASKQLFSNYHAAAPYAGATMDDAAQEVHRTGYVTTVLGRKSDFTRYGPKKYSPGVSDMPYEAACRKWGPYNIERSRTHKALNRKLQGGAADVMKKAMVEAYEAGLFDESACGIPLLTVHDELDFDDYTDPEADCWNEFTYVMENCMPQMRVPVIIDMSTGANWGVAD